MLLIGRSMAYVFSHRPTTLTIFSKKSPVFLVRLASNTPWEKECIIPDVICCAPKKEAMVCYGDGCKVEMGNELTPTQAKDMPCVTWEACDDRFYTLCMTGPDAPSRKQPKLREWHHWLVGNIPGCDVMQGETLSEYIGAKPGEGTGLQRYVFLIYQQPKRICCFSEPRLGKCSAENRECFSIRKFADKYDMGNPVAGNFFQAQWDCYVPFINKQLGIC